MSNSSLVSVILLISSTLNAQRVDLVTELNSTGMAINGTNLYVTEYVLNKIIKIDLSTTPATVTDVLTDLHKPYGLAFKGNDLYIAEENKISKIDVTASTITVATTVVTGLSTPNGMAFKGNELYISEFKGNKISKIDITANTTIAVDVVTNLSGPNDIAFKGNELYISEITGDKISKIAITATPIVAKDVITGLNDPYGLVFNNNDLYITEYGANQISKIAVTATPIVKTNSQAAIINPSDITMDGSYAYVSGSRKIIRIPFPFPVCTRNRPTVKKTGVLLTTSISNALTYAWLDCNNNNIPLGGGLTATSVAYRATTTGSYAVEIVRSNGCRDTSICTEVCVADKPTVAKSSAVLSINTVPGATYRWLDCGSSNAEVPNETTVSYTATASGRYAVELTRANGCIDTSLCTEVCIPDKPIVTKSGFALTTDVANILTYRWLDCGSNNTPIANETASSYTATANGSYAVEVIGSNGCKDTSICTVITGVGLIENTFARNVKLYPNPTTRDITIELGNSYTYLKIEVMNILGKVITSKMFNRITNKIDLPIEASNGVYFVRVEAKEGFASFRVVKK